MARILDPEDPRLAALRAVRDPEAIRRQGLFVAEGRRAVLEVLGRMPERVQSLLLTEAAEAALGDRLGRLPPDAALLVLGGPAATRAFTGTRFHQGCLATVTLPDPASLDDLPELFDAGPRLVVALEGVSDPDNVGGIFRSAAAFGADGVLVGPGCAHPLYRKSVRTSLGAVLRLPTVTASESWPDDLGRLHGAGYSSLALTPAGDTLLADAGAPDRVVVLAGAEGDGLSEAVLGVATRRVRIPMVPDSDSLNVSTATAIALLAVTPYRGTRVT